MMVRKPRFCKRADGLRGRGTKGQKGRGTKGQRHRGAKKNSSIAFAPLLSVCACNFTMPDPPHTKSAIQNPKSQIRNQKTAPRDKFRRDALPSRQRVSSGSVRKDAPGRKSRARGACGDASSQRSQDSPEIRQYGDGDTGRNMRKRFA